MRNRAKPAFAPIPEEALSKSISRGEYLALDDSMFDPKLAGLGDAEAVVRPSTTYWHDVWQRFRKDPLALFGLVVILVMGVACVFVPMFSK